MCLENVIEESRDCVGWVFLYMSNRNLKERKEKKNKGKLMVITDKNTVYASV